SSLRSSSPSLSRSLSRNSNYDKALLCLLPAALIFFWRTRSTLRRRYPTLWIILFTATTLLIAGCGSGGDPTLRYTPPGTYRYQITATSGAKPPQTVTLTLTVTAQ
ncbi:MAG TPA: hypothetical protein VK627_03455, partial [Edaphobacter sp.]|nr:hypothetical protein [Edaphobacter sp.]